MLRFLPATALLIVTWAVTPSVALAQTFDHNPSFTELHTLRLIELGGEVPHFPSADASIDDRVRQISRGNSAAIGAGIGAVVGGAVFLLRTGICSSGQGGECPTPTGHLLTGAAIGGVIGYIFSR